jgi:peptidoglycan/LPS O-acetylase OafA/YrhL
MNRKYYPAFNFLRGIACFIIALYHYVGALNYHFDIGWLDSALWNGNYVLDVFFMLSGFCLCAGYGEKILNNKMSAFEFLTPHYLKFVSFCLLTLPLTICKQLVVYKAGMDNNPNIESLVFDALNIRSIFGLAFPYNGPLWFINILFICYVFFFLILHFCRSNKQAVLVFLAALILALAVNIELKDIKGFFIFNHIVGQAMMNFFIGALLYALCQKLQKSFLIKTGISMVLVVLAGTIVDIVHKNKSISFVGNTRLVYSWMLWPAIIVLLSFIHTRRLQETISKYLGNAATSVYIWHNPILYILVGLRKIGFIKLGIVQVTIVFLIILAIVSYLSMTYGEKKIYRILKNFTKLQ